MWKIADEISQASAQILTFIDREKGCEFALIRPRRFTLLGDGLGEAPGDQEAVVTQLCILKHKSLCRYCGMRGTYVKPHPFIIGGTVV